MASTFDTGVDRRGTDCIKWDYQRKQGPDGTPLLPFTIADADWPTCPTVIEALHQRVENGVYGYTKPGSGYFAAVAGWCDRRHGWKIQPEWIVPIGSIMPAICNALDALLPKGAKVIVQTPVYNPFYSVIPGAGCEQVDNPLILDETGYHMDLEGFEALCKEGASALLLCNPHNPVCRVWRQEELDKLAELCVKYDLLVVSDEIHWDLALGGREQITMGRFEKLWDRLVVAVSCGKTFNLAGLETSNLIIPSEANRKALQDFTSPRRIGGPNTFGLLATQVAYETGDAWLDESLAYIDANAKAVQEFCKVNLPKVKVAEPEGTFLMWLDARAYGCTSDELVEAIANEGALLNGGKGYGEGCDGYLRFNIACPRSQLMGGLECIKRALDKL